MLMPKRVKHRKQQRGRMKGKAQRGNFIAYGEYKPGRVLFEMAGIPEETAREAMRLAAHKLPITTKFIKKEAVQEAANTEIGGEEQ